MVALGIMIVVALLVMMGAAIFEAPSEDRPPLKPEVKHNKWVGDREMKKAA